MKDLQSLLQRLAKPAPLRLVGAPDGYDAFIAADLARLLAPRAEDRPAVLVHVARDSQRSRAFQEALVFAEPRIEALELPAWDCQPYDRVSPGAEIAARRMTALSRLSSTRSSRDRPRVLCLTVNGLLQRVAPCDQIASETFSAAPGAIVDMDALARWLEANGFARAVAVRERGEYAVRGGILDLFPPGLPAPVRLDFFGDALESIRAFDPETQRTTGQLRALNLAPMSEASLTSEAIKRFRLGYVAAFGGQTRGDSLYEAVSEGRRHPGMEHWLPLFFDKMDSLFDYVGDAPFLLDFHAEEAADQRLALIADYHDARKSAYDAEPARASYKPLPANALYLDAQEWRDALARRTLLRLSPFAPGPQVDADVVDCGGRLGRSFGPERQSDQSNVFDAAVAHARALQASGRRVIIAGWSDGSRERLGSVLAEHGLKKTELVSTFTHASTMDKAAIGLAVLGLESGFETADFAIIGETDILGDRLVRQRRRVKKGSAVLAEAASLTTGDFVVHVDHGIGRFMGLKTIEAAGAPHDCLEIHYAGGDKLFLPVENLELLTRYGSEDGEAQLDKLGGVAWQNRRARMKKRILEMAKALVAVAAQRLLREAPKLSPPEPSYQEFCARFPYDETEDQLNAIDSVLDDLASGRPMDRLVCGDVGFGKTEVALRAAFAVAMNGKQVAVLTPTTLLARQHFKTFSARCAGLPIRIAQLSRMANAADQRSAREELAAGTVDIVVGTHAVLSKSVRFKDLGLVIVDEEQHFGVAQKERLKELCAEVHVLTLSATPIPRTMQLAMTGVRDLSIIATPPVDRLAVRSFVSPFDELIVREALMRELYRGGQSFFVCPRIEDLEDAAAFLRQATPEAKFVIAHGQMPPTELDDKMTAFYDGKYDILLSTAIVESGLDIPTANTLIVHRADLFGLAQLYQLRGRVGRSKTRAYALFTLPPNRQITPQAEKRLKVLESLDTLGAGFMLASHDLDIRGAGNLLGDEQSGHIKEVGYELYQQMVADAVEALRSGASDLGEEKWSPTITLGAPVTIPDDYVPDVQLRLQLYRRLSSLDGEEDIEAFASELIDRFGPMPPEVDQLMKLVSIKALCMRAHVEKLEAGPKGVIIGFKDNSFADPAGLVRLVSQRPNEVKVRPDMKVVFLGDFEDLGDRLEGARRIMRTLVGLAEKKRAA